MDRHNTMTEHPMHLGAIGSFWRSGGLNDRKGLFALSGVRAINRQSAVELTSDGQELMRCDRDSYGPYGFHSWVEDEERCTCGRTDRPEPVMGHHYFTLANISYVTVVMDVFPAGYILYFECRDEAVEEDAIYGEDSECGRTLQEVFRLMLEWDAAYTIFGNREPIAVTSHEMVSQLSLPDEVSDWLWSGVPAQKVERFLRSDPLARERLSGTPVPSGDFDNWATTIMMTSMPLGARRADR